jgi:hypothetical protein
MDPIYLPILAGVVGGLGAAAAGREETRFDNFVVGGLFTAFAAGREPLAHQEHTLALAFVEGAAWGTYDRVAPLFKGGKAHAEKKGNLTTPLMAGALGGLVAMYFGREETRFDNFVIGGLFTGFAASHETHLRWEQSLGNALFEGTTWGIYDRVVAPALREYLHSGAKQLHLAGMPVLGGIPQHVRPLPGVTLPDYAQLT